ncbi:hypothetical protein JTB14_017126 [Gonioctena quinquepunctata]|nr:hypothetical protein JTB14_017126 [Gonioctena quinquepunctata]
MPTVFYTKNVPKQPKHFTRESYLIIREYNYTSHPDNRDLHFLEKVNIKMIFTSSCCNQGRINLSVGDHNLYRLMVKLPGRW